MPLNAVENIMHYRSFTEISEEEHNVRVWAQYKGERESGGLGYYNAGMRAGENEFRPLVAAFGSVQP